jgi:hypothetical protein
MEEGHQVAEVVVAGAHPLAAVQQVEEVWTVDLNNTRIR